MSPGRLLIGLLGLLAAHAGAETPGNASFETGDFAGWTLHMPAGYSSIYGDTRPVGAAGVITDLSHLSWANPPPHPPIDGSHFAELVDGGNGVHTNGVFNIFLSQELTLLQGDTLSGWAFFFNNDEFEQDTAWVRIADAAGNALAEPWREVSGSLPGGIGHPVFTPWTLWQWTAPVAGSYTLELGVSTGGDTLFESRGFFDDVRLTNAAVPEPQAVSLALLGFIAFLPGRRKSFGRPG